MLEDHEFIDKISISCNIENRRIRGIVFGTNFERCLIMDGEVEASNLIDFPESVLNESEANVKSESQLSS